jgi:uncharacterized GH25 family protein
MLLPDKASARKGEAVTFTYQFGHPFEHQLFDAPPLAGAYVLTPAGKRVDLAKRFEKVQVPGADKKPVTAYRLQFTPEQRGDYVFVVHAQPAWIEDEKEWLEDTARVVLHVQAQKGWHAEGDGPLQLLPLTRPYGLQPGAVFQAQALYTERSGAPAKPWPGATFEIERYNAAPPKKLPPDEHVTRTARADPNGVVTTTLPEPGWWGVTAVQELGTRDRDGKSYPVRRRASLWVWVDPKISAE